MDFSPHSIASNQSLSPLMRFLHDVDKYSRHLKEHPRHHGQSGGHSRAFFPNFDAGELSSSHELCGELPGLERDDVKIEFSGPRTLEIRGTIRSGYDAPHGAGDNIGATNATADIPGTEHAEGQLLGILVKMCIRRHASVATGM
ncbi:heat shock protein 30 [Metarhizium rileyi]|uniref:Heat shock protein 30 n=1 Tax=Metarhizium rileyi (strain RCEF 4871) TaxID=1649241 RepID=A0A167GTT6_METRR|nr:heat shock protein 30 [Metarhizium rileyi RCEF 4871]